MKLSKFKFTLPEELIAKHPEHYRDESKLMVLHKKDGKIEHRQFKDIIEYFNEDDVFVMNNTKVFPARLYGNKEKTGARIEVFLLRELKSGGLLWDVLVDPARKIRIGNKLYFENEDGDELIAEVIDNTTSRGRTLRFLYDGNYDEFREKLRKIGNMPIPKYLGREADESDLERYQTIYSKKEGAVAAPTAGLHFSRELLKRLEIKGVKLAELTLHVGLGTFRPVEVEDVTKHKMDSEEIEITEDTADLVTAAIADKKRVCAVGTTVMRSIESSVGTEKSLKPFSGWSNKYIYPPYEFSIADAMVTNFHLPSSTLLMMACAFGGHEHVMNAYEVAIKEKYRFFSYGDAMLII